MLICASALNGARLGSMLKEVAWLTGAASKHRPEATTSVPSSTSTMYGESGNGKKNVIFIYGYMALQFIDLVFLKHSHTLHHSERRIKSMLALMAATLHIYNVQRIWKLRNKSDVFMVLQFTYLYLEFIHFTLFGERTDYMVHQFINLIFKIHLFHIILRGTKPMLTPHNCCHHIYLGEI